MGPEGSKAIRKSSNRRSVYMNVKVNVGQSTLGKYKRPTTSPLYLRVFSYLNEVGIGLLYDAG